MPKFSDRSRERLNTCHQDLVVLFNEVIKTFDCTVIFGYRNEDDQRKAFNEGKSKLQYPNSKHNSMPSMAADVAPYPIDWQDIKRFYLFGGYVLGVAGQLFEAGAMAHRVRYGGDWDMDTEVNDQRFNDLVHFELVNPE